MLTAAPPTGTVTFLFTDIEGSTRLWEQFPDAMNLAMARHDELLEEVVVEFDGYVFSRAGDGWGIAFASAGSAVRAALEIQRRMASESWPTSVRELRLRAGAHVGTANQRDGDFFGTSVNRAARVAGAANGGQVFVTDAVHALIADDTDDDWRLHDLGEHRLRDLTRPEHIWQIDSSRAAAPIADLGPRMLKGNLPKPGAAVIGRDELIDEVLGDLAAADVVTLVGVGGVGKTTVAIEAARRLGVQTGTGAWFVDLTTLGDPEDIASSIYLALGLAKRQDMSDIDGLIDALAAGDWILVVDNAEHIIEGVADYVDRIARSVATVKLIVTSREPLSISAETVRRVPSLLAVRSETSPAARLFIERAMAAAPDLGSEAFPLDVVTRICARLDGLPLAIEIAAAHAETMTPGEILAALESGNLALRSDSRSAVPRHRSIDDLVAWSYERLDDAAKRVFERLSIFVGGAVAEAALEVCSDASLDQASVRAALRTLVRKSLVAPDRSDGETRFTLLETLRRYARTRCRERPSNAAAEARHAHWFGDFARSAAAGMQSPSEAQWRRRTLREADNLEEAARWAAGNKAPDLLGQLGACLPVLLDSNVLPGADAWIELALDALPENHPDRINYAYGAAYLTLFRGDIEGLRTVIDTATAAASEYPTTKTVSKAFKVMASFFDGDMNRVMQEAPELIAALNERGDSRMAGSLHVDLGLAHLFTGDIEAAQSVADEFHQRARADGIPSVLGWSLYLLGEVASDSDAIAAVHHFEESVENALSVGGHFVAGLSLVAMAATAARNGDMSTALDAMYRALRLWYAAGNRPQFWTAIRNLVQILHQLDLNEPAYRLNLATEAAAGSAPELFGRYGELHRQVAGDVEKSIPEATRASIQRRSDLDYAATATYAVGVLEELIG